VLVDADRLSGSGAALSVWKEAVGRRRPLLIGLAEPSDVERIAQDPGGLDDVAPRPLSPGLLRMRLAWALERLQDRRAVEQLDTALARKGDELHELNEIGVALSAERDIDKLLELILRKCREITAADAGSLYLVERGPEGERLRFKLAQNDSLAIPFAEYTMPLTETSIAGYAALSGHGVNVTDAYALPRDSPFQVSRSFDEQSGYRTRSMLAVPMKDHHDEVIGVVQLINKKRDPKAVLQPVAVVEELVTSFTGVDEELVTSLSSQAAVAFENTLLIQDIKNLFDAFVKASVTAIESRDPTTSGHSERVALLTVGIAERVDALDSGPFRDLRFSRDQLQEIRYASLLHDFGKVGVREKVLVKANKLYAGEMRVIEHRFAYVKRNLEAEHLRAKLEQLQSGRATAELLEEMDRAHAQQQQEYDRLLEMVKSANRPSILEEDCVRTLLDLPARRYRDIAGEPQPLLTPNEVGALSIRRGSLSETERREIENHVTHTFKFLSQIPWTSEYRHIPAIAYAHHEKLDGTGYPRRLPATEIPVQSRMMTISDIYDALVAWDRPYKRAVPTTKALEILDQEARAGKLDAALLELFRQARIYERTDRTRLTAAGIPT
jgi:HD-GYP domain-containing protein (c-di-GMP phosphodiesterase class II)